VTAQVDCLVRALGEIDRPTSRARPRPERRAAPPALHNFGARPAARAGEKPWEPIEKLHRLTTSHGEPWPGKGMITGGGRARPGAALLSRRARLPLPAVPDDAGAAQGLQRRRDAPAAVLVAGVAGAMALLNIVMGRARWLALARSS
jgi:hypothetical protein